MAVENDSSATKRSEQLGDRKSTRLNSSHLVISYAVFCLKKKDPHHGPCYGLGLDRLVPGQRPHERPGDERAEQPRRELRAPALVPLADEHPGTADLAAIEL